MSKRLAGALVAVGALVTGSLSLVAATAGPAAATSVGDETALRAAFGDGDETQVDLTADITLNDVCPDGVVSRDSSTTIVVDGHGHTVTQTCTSGNSNVFVNAGDGDLTFQNITVTGGMATTANGGGISGNGGDISLINAAVVDNTSVGGGGVGANFSGDITLMNSTVSGNTATGSTGGGIEGGNVSLTNSTVSGNTVEGPFGGGIITFSGTVTLTNSTVSGNTAGREGGGIVAPDVTLVYSTVAGNRAEQGANIEIASIDTLTSFGSVVALPSGGGDNCFFAQGESTTSHGYNWDDDDSCGFGSGSGDQPDGGDPRLGSLASNGGPTETMLPQADSPLIDAVPAGSCQADGANGIATDQRGVTRPQGEGCDIGAVEVEVEAEAVVPTPAAPTPAAPVQAPARFTG